MIAKVCENFSVCNAMVHYNTCLSKCYEKYLAKVLQATNPLTIRPLSGSSKCAKCIYVNWERT